MAFEQWFAFAIASAVLLAIPGPTILLVISYALGHGRKAASATVGGVALGDFTAMTASMLGLGALLATSATLFTALKWIGAAYLIYLGIKLWRAPVAENGAADLPDAPKERPGRIFAHAYLVTALNPKSLIFFVAFLPQFIAPNEPHVLARMLELSGVFMAATFIIFSIYGLCAAAMRDRVIGSPRVMAWMRRTFAAAFVALGARLALTER